MATSGKTKVGSGIPGFGDSKGAAGREFRTLVGEFKVEILEAIPTEKDDGTVNVRIKTTLLGGPEQEDGWDPEGKENSWFINVDFSDPDKAFTIDNLKSVFLAAGVRSAGDEPPYGKLAGKTCAVQAWKKVVEGKPYQRFAFVSLKDSKTFAGDAE